MKTRLLLTLLSTTFVAGAALAEGVHWTYEGAEGPEFWGALSPDFAVCASGQEQSPIDLSGTVPADAQDVVLAWNPAAQWTVVNNGHTIQANTDNGGMITVGDTAYTLLQFHFHAPSEHAIDGTRAPMEAHFVHRAEDGRLAVIGVMMQGGGDNPLFASVMAVAPATPAEVAMGPGDPTGLMPATAGYLRYQGSLTTPPCSETVMWTVMKAPVAVADDSIAAFQALFGENARPLQPVHRRYILSE